MISWNIKNTRNYTILIKRIGLNEWYETQISKKIRAVWQSKAEHGECIPPSVPYGYKKSEGNPKQWVID